MRKLLAAITMSLTMLVGCEQNPPSLEAELARAMVKLARTPGHVSVEDIERTVRLRQLGAEMTARLRMSGSDLVYGSTSGFGFQGDTVVRFDGVGADAKIKYAVIDNVAHGGDLEQEVRLDLTQGLCLTVDIMRRASGIAPQPYTWPPSPDAPPGYDFSRSATDDLEFVVRDRYPQDERRIFLRGKAPCFNVVGVVKHFTAR